MKDAGGGGWGNTSIFSNSLLLQFLIENIPASHSRNMIPIPKQIPHRHTNSECNTNIQKNLTSKFADDRREIADLIRSWCTRRSRVFCPVNHWILHKLVLSHD